MIIERPYRPCVFDSESCVGQVTGPGGVEGTGPWLCDTHRVDLEAHGMDCCWECFHGRKTHIPGDGPCCTWSEVTP